MNQCKRKGCRKRTTNSYYCSVACSAIAGSYTKRKRATNIQTALDNYQIENNTL